MKAKHLFLLFFAFVQTINAQTDSLIGAFHQEKTASVRLELAFEIAKLSLGSAQDTAKKYLHLALMDSSKSSEKKPVGLCLNALGIYHYYEGNYAATEHFSGQAVKILSGCGDAISLMKARKNHALGMEWQGKYPQALSAYHQLLKENQQIGDTAFMVSTLADIGNVHIRTKNFEQAFGYLHRGLELTDGREGQQFLRANILNSIGNAYLELDRKDSAFVYLEQAYQIFHPFGISIQAMNVLTNLCNCYDADVQNLQYMDCHRNMLAHQKQFQDMGGIFRSYVNLAVGYSEKENCRSALLMLDSAKVYLGNIQDIYGLRGYYRNRSEQLFSCGEFQAAYLNRLEYERFRDSVFDVEKEQALQDVDAKYQNEKKQRDIDFLVEKDTNQQLVIQNQRWILVSGGLLVVAAGLAGFVVFVRQKARNELAKQEALHLMREEERVRIARDMHDEMGSGLTRISLLAQKMKWRQEKSNPNLPDEDLNQVFAESQELPRSLKDIIWALNPAYDTLSELVAKIRHHATEFMDASGISLEIGFPENIPNPPLSPVVRKNIFLIVKEAINNAVKHAAADKVKVSLFMEKGTFSIIIEDNGKGFDSSTELAGNGIFNMRKRAEWAGAELRVVSKEGKGSKVEILRIPIGNTTNV